MSKMGHVLVASEQAMMVYMVHNMKHLDVVSYNLAHFGLK